MNRRELFGFLAGGAVVAGGLWGPKKTIFLPPRGGWITASEILKQQQLMRDMVQAVYANMAKQFEAACIDAMLYGVGHIEIGGKSLAITPPPQPVYHGLSIADIINA